MIVVPVETEALSVDNNYGTSRYGDAFNYLQDLKGSQRLGTTILAIIMGTTTPAVVGNRPASTKGLGWQVSS